MSAWSRVATRRGLRTLAATGAAAATSAALGAAATTPDDPWYRALAKPPWDPPPIAFPLVWTPLYADIAVTGAAALVELEEQGRTEDAAMLRRTLAVNLVLNTGWSVLFWRSRRPVLSTVWCAALAAHSGVLVRRVASADPALGAALAPYPAWCTFATALNGSIARRNR
ncbi:TspO/MBR family protein [Marmoricola sp. Leaf446]|uniref:TspO/MBR family protein n=1 Tax=Marmoricola sp. Leaf446 TaxID=1736379 RepID=UPI0012E392DE|nr:TspO/MBR family protein [Marmoricola sp. Leaf446]